MNLEVNPQRKVLFRIFDETFDQKLLKTPASVLSQNRWILFQTLCHVFRLLVIANDVATLL
jgi:hypothetical protein